MGPTHRLFGALAGATVASAAGQPVEAVVIAAVIATSASNGPVSPDVDQTTLFKAAAELPIVGILFAHRHLTHWWGLPAGAWWWVRNGTLPADVKWGAYAVIVGWVSHLVGDFFFNKVPLAPWGGWRVGFGLKTDGAIESGELRIGRKISPVSPLRLVLAAALVWVLWATPAAPTFDSFPSFDLIGTP